MERMQGPLPKQASASHVLSCFSPPPELSPQYPTPLHHSSQALLWNNSGNAHQDLIHQASPWSSHCTHTQITPRTDLLNALSLQLKHGTANKIAPDGLITNNATHDSVVAVDALVTPSDNAAGLLNNCVHTEKNRGFTQAGVSSAPFHCKLDMPAAKSRTTLLASLSAHIAGDEDNGPVSMKMVDKPICGYGKSHQSRTEQRSFEEGSNEWLETQMKKDLQKQREEVGVAPVHSSGDGAIGLKLGKRTYFGDLGAGGVVEARKQAPNGSICNSNGGSIATNSNGGSAKKGKASSPAANVPRCQAEDCKIDLTSAKDYHRRHKVCEWHSKSSKAKVANLDQRFCQQCSRFHVLTEFDEGKRSCRRRLAGHNERRRKQQPEPFPLLSAASYAYFAGAKHLFSTSLMDHPHFFKHEHAGAVFKDLQKPKVEPVENYQPLELHHFMQASQRGDGHLLLSDGAQSLVLAGGNGTNLGSPPLPLTTLTACLVPDHPQPSPEILVSGRALSLLSSSLGFPNTSNSVSTALGVSSPSFEGHHGTSSCQIISRASSSCFTSNALKPIETLPLSHDHDINTLSGSESAAATHCLSMNQVQPSTMLSFGGSSAFPIIHENDVQSDTARPMLDLMQVSFARSGTPRHQAELNEAMWVFSSKNACHIQSALYQLCEELLPHVQSLDVQNGGCQASPWQGGLH